MAVEDQQYQALADQLGQALGHDQVKFDWMTRLLYSTDASNYQIVPIGVVFPRDSDEVCAVHEAARQLCLSRLIWPPEVSGS